MNKPIKAKPNLYTYIFFDLKEIALKYGYNLVIHGSMNRDLDLIAIAWQEKIKPHKEMIDAFVEYLGGCLIPQSAEQKKMPQGRISYLIDMNRGGKFNGYIDEEYYIDISVTPIIDED